LPAFAVDAAQLQTGANWPQQIVPVFCAPPSQQINLLRYPIGLPLSLPLSLSLSFSISDTVKPTQFAWHLA